MDYKDKEEYWEEMSYRIYPVLSQKERLDREYKEREYEFLCKYYYEEKCVRFKWGEW